VKTVDPTLLSDADFAVQVTLERAKKPASRWRNKWGAAEDCLSVDMATGVVDEFKSGDIIWGTKLFPSKEMAEEYAERAMEVDVARGQAPLEYLGAHPVEGDA
jgi:hypothetical protein